MRESNESNPSHDAVLVVSFGGPEKREDVMPFLENVLRGKNVPRTRMLEVAEHYDQFDGVSPINEHNRQLIAALDQELAAHGVTLPIYWGNRNWHPLLPDTLRQMADDGVRRALALFTTAYSSYSSCRQYRENIAHAQEAVGPRAPRIDKLRAYFNHPGFIEAWSDQVQQTLDAIPTEQRSNVQVVYTAHSIPVSMAQGCAYAAQLEEAARLVSENVGAKNHHLVYQSRSGPPSQPWLEPDVCDFLRELHTRGGCSHVVLAPVGFLSDHIEVLYDLDTEARQLCEELGLPMTRAPTTGTHPKFIAMIRELIEERTTDAPRRVVGSLPASHDVCPADCCVWERRK